jgi:hypothetical protein
MTGLVERRGEERRFILLQSAKEKVKEKQEWAHKIVRERKSS